VLVDVRPASARFVTRAPWVESRHSFSFGPHYDPANTRFGPLVAHNDDVLAPGGEFTEHPHRGVDIVTWVVEGELAHTDSSGGAGVVRPGVAQRLSAGSGVRHVESNASSGPTRYVQMWVIADDDEPPSYARAEVDPALGTGGLVLVASGSAPAPLSLRQPAATLLAGRLRAGQRADIPASALVHLYVVAGAVRLDGVTLSGGDAARVTEAAGLSLVAEQAALTDGGAEVLIWTFGGEARNVAR